MAKRSNPDASQEEVVSALERLGFTVEDLHNVPLNLPELAGIPDLLAINSRGLTILGDFDPRLVRERLADIPGLVVRDGAILVVEVKTDAAELRPDQAEWWLLSGLEPLVLRSSIEALRLSGRRVWREFREALS